MERSYAEGLKMAAAVNAVQCAIASADAVCVSHLGRRAAPQRHQDAAELLATCGLKGARGKAGQLRRILEMKHAAEYDDRALTAAEIQRLVERTRRFHEWAMGASGD